MSKIGKYALYAFIAKMAEESTKSINISISPMEIMAEKRTYGLSRKRFSKGGNNRIFSHHRKKGKKKK